MSDTTDQHSPASRSNAYRLAARFETAMKTDDGPWISPANLGRRLHCRTSEIKAILAGRGCSDLRLLVRTANLLMVDPRWLVLGVGPDVKGVPDRTLKTGLCRYCGCTDERACPGGCGWVDEIHTICSACLTAGDSRSRATTEVLPGR